MGKKETGTRQRWVKWKEDVQQIEERSVRYANLLCVYSSTKYLPASPTAVYARWLIEEYVNWALTTKSTIVSFEDCNCLRCS